MSNDDSYEWDFPYTLGRFYGVIHKPEVKLRIEMTLGAKDAAEFERLLRRLIQTFYEKPEDK